MLAQDVRLLRAVDLGDDPLGAGYARFPQHIAQPPDALPVIVLDVRDEIPILLLGDGSVYR